MYQYKKLTAGLYVCCLLLSCSSNEKTDEHYAVLEQGLLNSAATIIEYCQILLRSKLITIY